LTPALGRTGNAREAAFATLDRWTTTGIDGGVKSILVVFGIWNALVFAAWGIGPFVLAGTVAWTTGWLYFGVLAVLVVLHRLYVRRHNPVLRERRRRLGKGAKSWDLIWNYLFWPFMASIPLTGGLQFGHAGSTLPTASWLLGVTVVGAGFFLSAWAMASNRHFEGVVRIQAELDHRVVSSGPYRLMRHPGYVGLILWALGTPFLVLSWWALAPAGVTATWIVIRTALEDRVLRNELIGYPEYASNVRYRLIPRLW
jgi:protein-S-isoprenylcysteine O-methyltransferase Ste14